MSAPRLADPSWASPRMGTAERDGRHIGIFTRLLICDELGLVLRGQFCPRHGSHAPCIAVFDRAHTPYDNASPRSDS